MTQRTRTWTARLCLVAGSAMASLLQAEGAAQWLHLDDRILRQALYYQTWDLAVHGPSEDPFLHYELKPGSGLERPAPPYAPPYSVHIDEWGARFPTHPEPKSPGVFRILALGGSTMYGALVNDDQTIPARLEARLNQLPPEARPGVERFECWNFGVNAYVLSQVAHLARRELVARDADLILIQLFNQGRRPFDLRFLTSPQRVSDLPEFGRNFFLEQFWAPPWLNSDVHAALMSHSAVYRSVVAKHAPENAPLLSLVLSERETGALSKLAADRGVPVVYVQLPISGSQLVDRISPTPDRDRLIDLYRPGREPDFYVVHPPAATLDEFAGMIVESLRERNLVTRRHARYPSALIEGGD